MNALVDFPVKPEARSFVDAFAPPSGEPQWLAQARRRALARFAETGFPSRKSESWRYLDLKPLERRPLPPVAPGSRGDVPGGLALGSAAALVELVDGNCAVTLRRPLPEGVWLGSTRRALAERPDLLRSALADDNAEAPFAALNAAVFADGFVLDIAPGVVLDDPVEIVHFAAAGGSLHTRSVIVLARGSRARIIETFTGNGGYWTNDVLTARIGDGAELSRAVLVEEAAEAIHLAQLDAGLGEAAGFDSFALLLGGKRVRHEVNVCLRGEGARCRIDGAYLVTGSDEANIVTAVDHAAAGGETRELVKGVAADRGHGAFQGRIVVREHAQKTDAHQLSRNLIIGRRAAIDTKPELEIYADDVKCSHGATVGDLDEGAMFYLRARGIPEAEARRMLIAAFLREAVETVENKAIREHLLARLAARLEGLER